MRLVFVGLVVTKLMRWGLDVHHASPWQHQSSDLRTSGENALDRLSAIDASIGSFSTLQYRCLQGIAFAGLSPTWQGA